MGVSASNNPWNASNGCSALVTWNGWSVHGLLLPYLEQTVMFNAVNFAFDPLVCSSQNFNNTVFSAGLSAFLCPSDSNAGRNKGAQLPEQLLCQHRHDDRHCSELPVSRVDGHLYLRARLRIQDCLDGSSNTVAWSEALVGSGNTARPNYKGNGIFGPCYAWTPDCLERPTQTMATLKQCNTEWNNDVLISKDISYNKGQYWGWGAEAMSLFNTIVPPSSTQYPWGDCRTGCAGCCGDGLCAAADHSEISNANSNHPGGCNVLFGDGSVKFVKSSLSIPTWWALGTRNDCEVISADAY